MYEDGFESSVPIYQEIDDQPNKNGLLTRIPFDKGAAVFFMLENTVGDVTLRYHLRVHCRQWI